jgi:hypothetical protein
VQWFWSIGWGMLISSGLYAALAWTAVRERSSTGQHSVAQARRGALLYTSGATLGAVLLLLHYMG